jgi:gamma-glutamyltranspeptidase/glutathione hydrolase
VEAFDGRETAPAAADEKLFLGADGKPMPFYDGVVGGRSVGVPGTVRMLEMAHRSMASWPGRSCSSRRSRWPMAASRSARG